MREKDVTLVIATSWRRASASSAGLLLEMPDEHQLRLIVDELARRLSERGIFDMKGYKAQPGPGYYRRFGTLLGHTNWFVEYNEQKAARFGESLLWAGGPSADMRAREALPATEENPLRSYELDKNVLFPLDVPIEAARAGHPIPNRPGRRSCRTPPETWSLITCA